MHGRASEAWRVAHSTATRRTKVSTSRPLAQRGAATSRSMQSSSAGAICAGSVSRFCASCCRAICAAAAGLKSGKSMTSETRLLSPGLTLSSSSLIWPE
jgi:hypothetical protein